MGVAGCLHSVDNLCTSPHGRCWVNVDHFGGPYRNVDNCPVIKIPPTASQQVMHNTRLHRHDLDPFLELLDLFSLFVRRFDLAIDRIQGMDDRRMISATKVEANGLE